MLVAVLARHQELVQAQPPAALTREALVPSLPVPPAPAAPDPEAEALSAALQERISVGRDRAGRGIPAKHCRNADEGCDRRLLAFAEYMTEVGEARGLDPWLLGAMALRESTLNPFQRGAIGELGILQINPRRADAKQVRFMRDASYRKTCESTPGACQREIVEHAAHILEQALDACRGRLGAALGAYNTGRCGGNSDYTRKVLRERNALRAAARAQAALANRSAPVAADQQS
jgi:hypothetical protein